MTITTLSPSPVTVAGSNSVIGTAVLAKSLDAFEQSAEGMVRMMEQSVNPNVGKNFDVRI